MQVRYRSTHSYKFAGKQDIDTVIFYVLVAETFGWKLDVMQYSEGLSIDDSGLTVHLCKFSDGPEELIDTEVLMDVCLNKMMKKRPQQLERRNEQKPTQPGQLANNRTQKEAGGNSHLPAS